MSAPATTPVTPPATTAGCPCCSGLAEAACCGPFLAGQKAPTAQALMRSRFTAYVRQRVDYVIATHDPARRAEVDEAATAEWARETTWTGLEILGTERGGAGDDDGVVEFIASGTKEGRPFTHRERSTFRRHEGQWFYVAGVTPPKVPVIRAATPGRNDVCPCGSGKKYKRCHGA